MIRHPHYLEVPWEMHWHPTVREHRHLWLIVLVVILVMLMIGVGVATGLI